MARELRHFEAISFYKAIIGANNMTSAKKKNMPEDFRTYPDHFL